MLRRGGSHREDQRSWGFAFGLAVSIANLCAVDKDFKVNVILLSTVGEVLGDLKLGVVDQLVVPLVVVLVGAVAD